MDEWVGSGKPFPYFNFFNPISYKHFWFLFKYIYRFSIRFSPKSTVRFQPISEDETIFFCLVYNLMSRQNNIQKKTLFFSKIQNWSKKKLCFVIALAQRMFGFNTRYYSKQFWVRKLPLWNLNLSLYLLFAGMWTDNKLRTINFIEK